MSVEFHQQGLIGPAWRVAAEVLSIPSGEVGDVDEVAGGAGLLRVTGVAKPR